MKEFLSRSETDFSNHTRHTLSRESAQEELLVCLGLTLKDKLQNHWKTRKNEEIIKLMFYNIVRKNHFYHIFFNHIYLFFFFFNIVSQLYN